MGICQIFWILTIWSIPRHSLAGGAVTGCCHGKYWQRQYLKKTIFGAEHLQASPLLALLIGRYSPHCRHKPLSPNILGNIFLDKLGQWQMWRVDSLWTGGRENYSGMKKKGGRRRDFTISYDLLRTFQQSATMCGGGPWCSRLFRDSPQKILSSYTPLSVKICFLLGNYNSKFWKFREINSHTQNFFLQNFQNHKGAANDIKGAAASLLVNSKISIFNWELP